jgi:hypothetical protein
LICLRAELPGVLIEIDAAQSANLDVSHSAALGKHARGEDDAVLLRGKERAAECHLRTELPRLYMFAALCRSGEDS